MMPAFPFVVTAALPVQESDEKLSMRFIGYFAKRSMGRVGETSGDG